MKFVYLGADVPSNRKLLESAGVTSVGVSYWRLTKRGLPKNKKYDFNNYFPASMEIHVHAGIPDTANLTLPEVHDFAREYFAFVQDNLDRITTATEMTHRSLSRDFIEDQRAELWSQIPSEKFVPVWDSDEGTQALTKMSLQYKNIGIFGYDVEDVKNLAPITQSLSSRNGVKFHAISMSQPDNLRQNKFETVSSLAWLSPMMHGETIVWDGTKLARYPKRMKDQARSRYRHIYEKLGLDYNLIMDDNAQEISKLAIWSYKQLENRMNQMNNDFELYDNSDENEVELKAETDLDNADNKGSGMRKLVSRNPEEMATLPVFGVEVRSVVERDDEGRDVIADIPVLKSQSVSLRMCDTCFVASNCPAFKPQNTCAFNLPVEVKTKEQLKALINAMIEMQGQRIAFARFSEEMNGGYPDPNLSQEIDRLFKLIKTVKELDDSREFIKMTVERQGSAGVLSALFGDRAQALKELPNGGYTEGETTEIIQGIVED